MSAFVASQARAIFTYDLRFAPDTTGMSADGKTVNLYDAQGVANPQTNFTVQIWGQISSATGTSGEFWQSGYLSVKSVQVTSAFTSGGVTSALLTTPFSSGKNGSATAGNGITNDGITDWGASTTSWSSSTASPLFSWSNPDNQAKGYAASQGGEAVAGMTNGWEVLLGTFTVTPGTIAAQGDVDKDTQFALSVSSTGYKFSGIGAVVPNTTWYEDGTNPLKNGVTGATGTLAFGTNVDFKVSAGVPEPASLGVLALGGLALLARRRRRA